MKKLVLLLTVILLTLCLTSCGEEDSGKGFYFEVNPDGKTCTITGIDSSLPEWLEWLEDIDVQIQTEKKHLKIPKKINGYTVTSIGEDAFLRCYSLTSVTIPNSVTSIGEAAFCGCDSLTSIVVDENNQYYKSIDGNLYSKDGHTLIQYAIGKKDTHFTIPDGVTSIGDYAFYSCDSLTSIVIPDSVTSIGDRAFSYCDSLTSMEVDENNQYYKSIDGNLYSKDGHTLIQYAIGKKDTHFTIPDGVTSIGDYAFNYCDSLINITIPDGVTSIGDYAFYSCDSLTSIFIPNSVTSIGILAFLFCDSLTSVYIADIAKWCEIEFFFGESNPLYCGADLYLNNKLLNEIVIPDGVTSIGNWAFYWCDSITSVTIPDSVTSIGNWAFAYCDSLTSVTIPDSVTSIGNWAFAYCDSLMSIEVDENNQYYKSIDGNLYSKDESILIQYTIGKKDTHFTIPNSVTSIGDDAFSCCDSLISITIPNGVTSIGDDAFWSCDNLYIIYNNGNVDLSLGAKSNGYIARNAKVIVNKDGISYADDGNKYILTDDGFLFKYKQGEYTLIAYDGRESKVTLPEKINGSSYSLECVKGLTEVIIPDGVSNIEANSFGDSLRSITIPASVINIDAEAFVDCTRLQNTKVSEENTAYKSIDGNLYTKDGQTLLMYAVGKTDKQFAIPDEMVEINITASDDLYYIESVVIHKGVTNIADSAFSGCENLEYVYFTGTQEEWKNIVFGEYNDNLINAIIVYEYIPE